MSQISSPDRKRRKLRQDPLKEAVSASLYEYEKIEGENDIRLIVLLPGQFRSNVQCEFITSDLESPPDYEALSYTWADSDEDQSRDGTVWCEPGGQRILVTRNCEDALRRLRLEHEARFLWVDAICINQAFLQERDRQIAMMPNIYHSASRVIVYLGNGTTETDEFLDFLKDGPLDVETALTKFITPGKLLLSHRWFTRLWVLQEIALARAANIICGTRIVPWKKLSEYYRNAFCKTGDVRDFQHLQVLFAHALKGFRPMRILPELFTESYLQSSLDPRDRVFALLGIVSQGRLLSMVPKYTASNGEVFKELAMYFLKQFSLVFISTELALPSADCNILFMDKDQAIQSNNWSSWVFDWSQQRVQQTYPLRLNNVVSIRDLGGALGILEISGRKVMRGTICKNLYAISPRISTWSSIKVRSGRTYIDGRLGKNQIVVEVSVGFFVVLYPMVDHYAILAGVADYQSCHERGEESLRKLHIKPGQCTSACARPRLELENLQSFMIL